MLFHSPPGVLFTFPSRYSALSVATECSALEGGPPSFPRDSSCPAVLRLRRHGPGHRFAYGALTRSGRPSQTVPLACPRTAGKPRAGPATPAGRSRPVWAPPRSLAATGGISFDFSSCGYSDGSLPRVWLPAAYVFGRGTHALRRAGYPIRTSADLSYAAAPRGLSQLAASFIAWWLQGILHGPSIA